MNTINRDRRRFLGTAALAIAAAELGMIGSAPAQSDKKTRLRHDALPVE
jgi:nitrous oxide reductase